MDEGCECHKARLVRESGPPGVAYGRVWNQWWLCVRGLFSAKTARLGSACLLPLQTGCRRSRYESERPTCHRADIGDLRTLDNTTGSMFKPMREEAYRDRDTDIRLVENGWTVLRIREHVPIDEAVSTNLAHLARLNMS